MTSLANGLSCCFGCFGSICYRLVAGLVIWSALPSQDFHSSGPHVLKEKRPFPFVSRNRVDERGLLSPDLLFI